jgi:tRNA nucleotidyltransferase (CCA-adding enzyme)
MPETTDLVERLEARATPFERAALDAARRWCDAAGAGLYAVGGTVRDLLLGPAHLDLDLVVEGDVVALASALAEQLSATLTTHAHFGTATVAGDAGSLDLARSRSETYAYPGALPRVEAAPIERDLGRRDFTTNAMALGLAGAQRGRLVDPFGGASDLGARQLRVLHGESFRDDPTRILRLARYAARLSFAVETQTHTLAQRDATFLAAVSPARVTHELERTFAERFPEVAVTLLQELKTLTAIYPSFRLPADLAARFATLREDGGPSPATPEYLCALVADWSRPQIQGLCDALEPRHEVRAALHDVSKAARALTALEQQRADPAAVVEGLAPLAPAAVRGAGAAAGGHRARLVRRYLCEWRNVRPHLRGDDAIALGVTEGPAVGEVLQLLRAGRLRGELLSEEDERRLVRSWLAGPREGREDGR